MKKRGYLKLKKALRECTKSQLRFLLIMSEENRPMTEEEINEIYKKKYGTDMEEDYEREKKTN